MMLVPLLEEVESLREVGLTGGMLLEVAACIDLIEVPKNHFVYQCSDPADCLYIVLEGIVEMQVPDPKTRKEFDRLQTTITAKRQQLFTMNQTQSIDLSRFPELPTKLPPFKNPELKSKDEKVQRELEVAKYRMYHGTMLPIRKVGAGACFGQAALKLDDVEMPEVAKESALCLEDVKLAVFSKRDFR
jgi:CRP-like cAMP-binding protein